MLLPTHFPASLPSSIRRGKWSHGIQAIWILLLAAAIASVCGCATLPSGRGWGQDATAFPGWHRLWAAAKEAALEPATWGPLAGALAFQAADLDRKVAGWTSEHTPLFGSQENADRASDYLTYSAFAAYLSSGLVTPSGEDRAQWALAKAKGIAIGGAAIALTDGMTDLLKETTHRQRPDGTSERSFPSAHASAAAVNLTLASRNLDSLPLSGGTKAALRVGFFSMAMGTAWARLEAGKHFPSDVLVGAALGHFLGAFFNDAFLGLDLPSDPSIALDPSRRGVRINLFWPF